MALTDEQFKQFMDGIQQTQKFWELLIRIDENTKNYHKAHDAHIQDDAAQFGIFRQSLEKVHLRVDEVKKEVSSTNIKMGVISDEIKKFKYSILGMGLLITAIVFVVNFYINVYNANRVRTEITNYESPVRNA